MENAKPFLKFSLLLPKVSTFALLATPKPLTVWITTNCGKFWKRWQYQTTWPASWETCMRVRKQQLQLDMELQTCFKSGKEYLKAINCHPAYLTCTQGTWWEMLTYWMDEAQAGIKVGWRNTNSLRDADDTTLMAEGEEELTSLYERKSRVKMLA